MRPVSHRRRARVAARAHAIGCRGLRWTDARQHPFDQSPYQVRLEWGVDGLARLAPSDIVVVVDVLRFSSTVIEAVERGEDHALDAAARAVSINGAAVAEAAARRRRGRAARRPAQRRRRSPRPSSPSRQRRGARTSVAVIACGRADRAGCRQRRCGSPSRTCSAPVRSSTRSARSASTTRRPRPRSRAESFRALRGATRHLLDGERLGARAHRARAARRGARRGGGGCGIRRPGPARRRLPRVLTLTPAPGSPRRHRGEARRRA